MLAFQVFTGSIGASSSNVELAEKYWDGEHREAKLEKSSVWIQKLFSLSERLKKQARAAPKPVADEAPEDREQDAEQSRREAQRNRRCTELGMDAQWLTEDMDPLLGRVMLPKGHTRNLLAIARCVWFSVRWVDIVRLGPPIESKPRFS